ncbi:hypothetical protein E2562_036938 [Oryza meyeriana var. granulata]|uniref:CCHC-type domain-containing protein n=1 Tax=Oryza meyeriana var. granulata TaxID=110450 RepID=A0A6G1CB39_9ORYZ|nr:hypothetical protein E2562_036938 [Oryza meyeriana var. granulata]
MPVLGVVSQDTSFVTAQTEDEFGYPVEVPFTRTMADNPTGWKTRACNRCGEIGHYTRDSTANCPNYEGDHESGECPAASITCFLCEGTGHVPKECRLKYLPSGMVEIQRIVLRLVNKALASDKTNNPSDKFL